MQLQGAFGSSVGLPAALAAHFALGAVESAAEQWISGEDISIRRSITDGLANAVSGASMATKQPSQHRCEGHRSRCDGSRQTGKPHPVAISTVQRRQRRPRAERSTA